MTRNSLASALLAGGSTITATLGAVSNSTTLTVGPGTLLSVTVAPPSPRLATGTTAQLTATGDYSDASTQDLTGLVVWTSSNATIASVDSAGVVTARQAGTATITATLGRVSDSTVVTVFHFTPQLIVVTPINHFSDGTTQDSAASAHWSSSSASVSTINNGQGGGGLAKGKRSGTAIITATYSGVSGTTTLTVN
jgi:trimeric autotransporter adhesin